MIVPELITQDEAPREGLFLADFDAASRGSDNSENCANLDLLLNILRADMPMKGINHVHQQSAARTATP